MPKKERTAKSNGDKGKHAEKSGVKELVELGKTKGYVTYDDVNELLDEDITEEAEIEDVLITLREYQVEVRDEVQEAEPAAAPAARRRRAEGEAAEESESSSSSSADDGGTDYVRMYMRDMGSVPLLTREGEVAIAMRIEEGENAVFDHALVLGS